MTHGIVHEKNQYLVSKQRQGKRCFLAGDVARPWVEDSSFDLSVITLNPHFYKNNKQFYLCF